MLVLGLGGLVLFCSPNLSKATVPTVGLDVCVRARRCVCACACVYFGGNVKLSMRKDFKCSLVLVDLFFNELWA